MFFRFSVISALLIFSIGVCTSLQAQDPTFVYSGGDVSVPASGGQATFSLDVSLLQSSGLIEETRGFSFSAAHDSAVLGVVAGGTGTYVPETLGPLNSLNGGSGPDFIQGEIFPAGVTCGVIYAFTAVSQTITYDVAKPVIRINYQTVPGALTGVTGDLVTQISQGAGLGSPPTATVVVVGAGTSAPATFETSNITIQTSPPLSFTCRADDAESSFSGASGEGSATVGVSISENLLPGASPSQTQGFSMGLSYDSSTLTALAVNQGPTLAALESGTGPEYYQVDLLTGGLTVGVIYDFQGQSFVPYGSADQVLTIDFDTVPATLAGTAPGTVVSTTLSPVAGLGPTGVTLVMVVAGSSVSMTSESGTLSLTSLGGFDRGDCNADSLFDLADVIALLGGLFSGDALSCLDACDGNDDELLDIADAIKLLGVLFSGDTPPPGSGTCAPDTAGTALDCASFPPCE